MMTITGYMVASTNKFVETEIKVNGDFEEIRNAIAVIHGSDIYFRIAKAPEGVEEQIINMVCAHFSVYPDEIFVRSRKRALTEPRQIIQYLLKKHTKLTITRIGEITGKDHATILHSYKVISDLIETDAKIKKIVSDFEKIIFNNK